MNIINSIINDFSEDEKREFISYLKKKNRRGDVKNLTLFKTISLGKTIETAEKIYGKSSKNAFHALCNRLQNNLIDFVASKSFSGETSEEMEIMKLLLASRIFFEHKNNKVAFKTLLKAEKKALELDLYSILNEIYTTKIQYAHLNSNLVLSEIFEDSEKNALNFQREFQLNMAYASIKNKIKFEKGNPASEIITQVFSDFNIEIAETLTYKSLFQLMNLTSTAAKLQSDYNNISTLMENIYGIIKNKKIILAEKHLFYHIEILHLMAVASFRNKQFKKSEDFIAQMQGEMLKRNRIYFKLFQEKLTLIKAMNLNYTGRANEAIGLLEKFKGNSAEMSLSLCTFLFQQHRFNEAYQIFKEFSHSDIWYEKKNGWIWVLKKSIIEILILIELDKLDLVFSRLNSFKRKFNKRLKEIGEERVLTFMGFVNNYYENPKMITSEKFKNKVETSFVWIGAEREDIFVMSFYAWLKSKMEKKNLYETTLELVMQK